MMVDTKGRLGQVNNSNNAHVEINANAVSAVHAAELQFQTHKNRIDARVYSTYNICTYRPIAGNIRHSIEQKQDE